MDLVVDAIYCLTGEYKEGTECCIIFANMLGYSPLASLSLAHIVSRNNHDNIVIKADP